MRADEDAESCAVRKRGGRSEAQLFGRWWCLASPCTETACHLGCQLPGSRINPSYRFDSSAAACNIMLRVPMLRVRRGGRGSHTHCHLLRVMLLNIASPAAALSLRTISSIIIITHHPGPADASSRAISTTRRSQHAQPWGL